MIDLGAIDLDLDRRVEEYLRIRRSLGFKLERDGKLLAQFIGYLREQGADTITVDHAVAWVGLPAGGRGWCAARRSCCAAGRTPPAGSGIASTPAGPLARENSTLTEEYGASGCRQGSRFSISTGSISSPTGRAKPRIRP